MTQLESGTLWSSFRLVLDLESRAQQIENSIATLKSALSDPGAISLPEMVGASSELRWHLRHSLRQLEALESAVGLERRNTEQKPSRASKGHSLRGSTKTMSLPDLIGMLSAQRKSGSLWIKGKSERFILELADGAVVHVMSDSPRPEQRLGDLLVARNRLSTERLEEFLEQYCPQDGKIGELMTRAALVSEDDVRDSLEWQVRELFQRLAGQEDAVFCFREGAVSQLELQVCMNTTQLLLESAQAQDEQAWADETSAEEHEDTEGDEDVGTAVGAAFDEALAEDAGEAESQSEIDASAVDESESSSATEAAEDEAADPITDDEPAAETPQSSGDSDDETQSADADEQKTPSDSSS